MTLNQASGFGDLSTGDLSRLPFIHLWDLAPLCCTSGLIFSTICPLAGGSQASFNAGEKVWLSQRALLGSARHTALQAGDHPTSRQQAPLLSS